MTETVSGCFFEFDEQQRAGEIQMLFIYEQVMEMEQVREMEKVREMEQTQGNEACHGNGAASRKWSRSWKWSRLREMEQPQGNAAVQWWRPSQGTRQDRVDRPGARGERLSMLEA